METSGGERFASLAEVPRCVHTDHTAMWSAREQQDLAVWADQLQALGDPLGELITASIMADELERGHDTKRLTTVREHVARLERELRGPLLAEILETLPQLELSWTRGVLTSLRLVVLRLDRPADELFEALRELLSLPLARFVRQLRVDVHGSDWRPLHRELPGLLVDPRVLARPWSLILGRPPTNQRSQLRPGQAALGPRPDDVDELVALERGLRCLYVDGKRVMLPWQRGDKGARLRAAASLAERNPDMTRLARALWDPSLRVRLKVIDTLPLLGVEAAPFVADLLLVDRGELHWLTRVREVLATLARNPELVGAVAHNFSADQPRCAGWLAASPLAVAREAEVRLRGMVSSPGRNTARAEFEHAQRQLAHRGRERGLSRMLDRRTPGSAPLLARLDRWLRTSSR